MFSVDNDANLSDGLRGVANGTFLQNICIQDILCIEREIFFLYSSDRYELIKKNLNKIICFLNINRTLRKDLGSVKVNEVVRMSNYNLRNIAFIRKYLDENSVKTLVHSCVINRLDYCNSIYYNLSKYQLKRLQSVMNKAARLIKKVSPFNRITPVLIELH